MISAIGNRWAIRGPHQSLLLSLLAFRYSAIRFNMLSSFFYCMFPPPSFSCNVDYSADDNNRTFKIWMQTLEYPHSFFTLRFSNLNHSHKNSSSGFSGRVFFFGSPLIAPLAWQHSAAPCLSMHLWVHAYLNRLGESALDDSPPLATHPGLSALWNRRRWPSGDPRLGAAVIETLHLRPLLPWPSPEKPPANRPSLYCQGYACGPLIWTLLPLLQPYEAPNLLFQEQGSIFAVTFALVIVSLVKEIRGSQVRFHQWG